MGVAGECLLFPLGVQRGTETRSIIMSAPPPSLPPRWQDGRQGHLGPICPLDSLICDKFILILLK